LGDIFSLSSNGMEFMMDYVLCVICYKQINTDSMNQFL